MQPDPPGGSAQMFGLVLRQLRGQAGLSLRELGKRALYDYTRLSRAENGETLIPAEKVRLLDEVLQAGGLLIALREAAGTAVPVLAPGPGSVEASESVTLEVRLPDGGIVHVAMSRRQFSQLLATAALSPVLPVVAGPGETSRLTRVIEQPALLDGEVIASEGDGHTADIGPLRVADGQRLDVEIPAAHHAGNTIEHAGLPSHVAAPRQQQPPPGNRAARSRP